MFVEVIPYITPGIGPVVPDGVTVTSGSIPAAGIGRGNVIGTPTIGICLGDITSIGAVVGIGGRNGTIPAGEQVVILDRHHRRSGAASPMSVETVGGIVNLVNIGHPAETDRQNIMDRENSRPEGQEESNCNFSFCHR